MPRFNPTRFPPGFFDLPADAGRDLPLDVIAAWTRSDQTTESARELLAPFKLKGIAVSSDAAGLTRLTEERSLIEILALVSRPKELVHAYGKAIGGIPLGVWAADNTLMFYPEGVAPDHVISMLLSLRDRVQAECEVGIGFCCHLGVFYELGNGLYGPDADRVEGIAEDFTIAGELVVTGDLASALGATRSFTLANREDLAPLFGQVLRVTDGPRLGGIEASDFRYPLPFTDEFFGGLVEFQRTRRTSVVPRPAFREATVVVIEAEREDRDVPEVAALNDLAMAAARKRLGQSLIEDLSGLEVKTSGGASGVSIYLFEDARHAVDFARKLRSMLQAQQVQLRIGVDVGRVLLFELGPGLRDVAGSPVNVASKLAQQGGGFGGILLTAQAARRAGLPDVTAARGIRAGGVTLEVVAL
jgi:class 3 adenylate cyclase